MKILVFGKQGQLARSLAATDQPDLTFDFAGSDVCDISNADQIHAMVESARPDGIVNAAAYTAVDKAEKDERRAYEVNSIGAGHIAMAAAARRAPLVHISTDYVFDGSLDRPYREGDLPFPLSAYGRTKLAGEYAVRRYAANCAILRTSWVFSPYGGNFVKTMLRLAGERDRLTIVDDQIGNPTYAPEIARAAIAALRSLAASPVQGCRGRIYNFAGPEQMSWCAFAERIMASAGRNGLKTASVSPITTADYPTPAIRPANSRLDSSLVADAFGIRHAAIDVCLDKMLGAPQKSA